MPTLAEKINTIKTIEELEGFRFGLEFQELLTDTAMNLLATRKVEIQRDIARRK